MGDSPVLPDYGGACLSNVIPALLGPHLDPAPAWFPPSALQAPQVVFLVLDGLGWDQLQAHRSLMPVLSAMDGGPITSVVPSTTATALTSISTGLPPGEHGVVGYRIDVHGEVLNVLRWSTPRGDARRAIPPEQLQPYEPFLGQRPPVVTKAEFFGSGFSLAHLNGVRWRGWRVPSTLTTEVRDLLAGGEPFVYAYYDGIDKVAHEYGLGAHYRAELTWVDRLIGDLLEVMPPGGVLLITADHGQVDVGDNVRPLERGPPFAHSWTVGGRASTLAPRLRRARLSTSLTPRRRATAGCAWVVSREQVVDEGWLGPRVLPGAVDRLGRRAARGPR